MPNEGRKPQCSRDDGMPDHRPGMAAGQYQAFPAQTEAALCRSYRLLASSGPMLLNHAFRSCAPGCSGSAYTTHLNETLAWMPADAGPLNESDWLRRSDATAARAQQPFPQTKTWL